MDKDKKIPVELEDGKKVTIVVKNPTTGITSRANRIHAKTWTECIQDGIMTKKGLAKFMKENGIWDDEKEKEQLAISQKLVDLERKLFVKKGRSSKVKASEGKKIAVEMRQLRAKLRLLLAERIAMENHTAESIADNAKFDFLVSACTYYENGQKVYNTLEDYINSADSEIAFAAASALASMMYSLDQDFESRLPENKFLKMFNFVDDELSLVGTEGHRVDLEGRRVNSLGQFIDEEGNRVDIDGNPLDEDGNYVPSVTYVDDNGKKINPNG